MAEAGIADVQLARAGSFRPCVDDAREVSEVVCDRRRELERRRRRRSVRNGVRKNALLAVELGIDLVRQQRRLGVEAEHERASERSGSHRKPFAIVAG